MSQNVLEIQHALLVCCVVVDDGLGHLTFSMK